MSIIMNVTHLLTQKENYIKMMCALRQGHIEMPWDNDVDLE